MMRFDKNESTMVYALALQSPFDTLTDYDAFYANASAYLPKPVSTDISDENFGYQRTTVKGSSIRIFNAGTDKYPSDAGLTVAGNVAKICGGEQCTSLESLAKSNALYISDFSDFSKWTQPSVSGKFVASVVGYFCYNEDRKKLLPLAIHVVDNNLTYTPFDNSDDWTLAKMMLDTADVNFQLEQHLANSHAVFIPLRVEVFRNLAAAHPVSALLPCTNHIDFVLEKRATAGLFNASTLLDVTFGWGAVGCLQFVAQQLQFASVEYDFEADIASRGLQHLLNHKYALYGKLYRDVFECTAGKFLDVFYASDKAVADDTELQNFAKGCAGSPQSSRSSTCWRSYWSTSCSKPPCVTTR